MIPKCNVQKLVPFIKLLNYTN